MLKKLVNFYMYSITRNSDGLNALTHDLHNCYTRNKDMIRTVKSTTNRTLQTNKNALPTGISALPSKESFKKAILSFWSKHF